MFACKIFNRNVKIPWPIVNFRDFSENLTFPWLFSKFPDFSLTLNFPDFSLTSGNPVMIDNKIPQTLIVSGLKIIEVVCEKVPEECAKSQTDTYSSADNKNSL